MWERKKICDLRLVISLPSSVFRLPSSVFRHILSDLLTFRQGAAGRIDLSAGRDSGYSNDDLASWLAIHGEVKGVFGTL